MHVLKYLILKDNPYGPTQAKIIITDDVSSKVSADRKLLREKELPERPGKFRELRGPEKKSSKSEVREMNFYKSPRNQRSAE